MTRRRPTNRRIANLTGIAAFAVTLAALGLTGAAIAWLDAGSPGEGPGPLPAVAVLLAASALLGLAARFLTHLLLSRLRPDGV